MFDLVSDDELRRRRAVARSNRLIEDHRRANVAHNDVWWRAGKSWTPGDEALAAEMRAARAVHDATFDETIYAPISAYLESQYVRRYPSLERGEPYAVLILSWEAWFPDEWRRADKWWSRASTKDMILRTMAGQGVTEEHRETVEGLLLSAVSGPYRCKDWRYSAVARMIDSENLRAGLDQIASGADEDASLRAQFVLSRLENRALSVNIRSYGNWLAQQ
ncbi:hypothetical protein ACFV9G_26415 [Nocardioides sp. NPDC059952]|uniref:hypothetical protein n=1 Tax=Nocardioides sp. NPDC059952 TaxID=3347014 RepID=UPI0036510944